ncbi:MAG: hypothetical protein AB7S38_02910 [Vulcanimicrobiota bacterium]
MRRAIPGLWVLIILVVVGLGGRWQEQPRPGEWKLLTDYFDPRCGGFRWLDYVVMSGKGLSCNQHVAHPGASWRHPVARVQQGGLSLELEIRDLPCGRYMNPLEKVPERLLLMVDGVPVGRCCEMKVLGSAQEWARVRFTVRHISSGRIEQVAACINQGPSFEPTDNWSFYELKTNPARFVVDTRDPRTERCP